MEEKDDDSEADYDSVNEPVDEPRRPYNVNEAISRSFELLNEQSKNDENRNSKLTDGNRHSNSMGRDSYRNSNLGTDGNRNGNSMAKGNYMYGNSNMAIVDNQLSNTTM